MEKHSEVLDSLLSSRCDGDIVVEESLLNDVKERFGAVKAMSASRLMKLTHKDAKCRLLACMDNGRKQLTRQPTKFASQAQVEQVLAEHVVSY